MIKQKGSKVPQIRVRGFEADWEEKPIGAILSEVKRSIVLEDNQQYELITVKRRNEGVISRGYLFGRNILVKNYSQLETGDFVISKRQVVHGATGIVPADLDKAIVSNEYLVATENNEISTAFLTIISSLPDMKRNFLLSSYGVDIEKLFFDADDWKKRTITLPIKKEQIEISSYFNELNRMIELYQRKHEKLLILKKAMLEKMFPQLGATTPEIRFKGFEGDWHERKLVDVVDVCSGRDYKHLSPGDIPVYGTGGYMLSVDKALSYDRDAIGIGRKGSIDKPYILKSPFWTVDTLFYAVNREHFNLDFIFCIFQKVDWRKKNESTGVPSLSKTAINDVTVLIPHETEQKKIGRYFYKLDELISIHSIQLEKIKQIKSACLGKMFV